MVDAEIAGDRRFVPKPAGFARSLASLKGSLGGAGADLSRLGLIALTGRLQAARRLFGRAG